MNDHPKIERGLSRERITDKNGKRTTVWKRNQESAASTASGFLTPHVPRRSGPPAGSTPASEAQTITEGWAYSTQRGGSTHHYDADGRLHRAGGLPAVQLANGQTELHEHGEFICRSMPGLSDKVDLAVYLDRYGKPSATRISSTTGPARTKNGVPQFYLHGVHFSTQADWERALKLSWSDFTSRFPQAALFPGSVSERLAVRLSTDQGDAA